MKSQTVVLLALAAWRTTRLATSDTITQPIRDRVRHTRTVPGDVWRPLADHPEGNPRIPSRDVWDTSDFEWRYGRAGMYVSAMLSCAWCAGFWSSLAWVEAHRRRPAVAVRVALPFALSAVVGVLEIGANRLTR